MSFLEMRRLADGDHGAGGLVIAGALLFAVAPLQAAPGDPIRIEGTVVVRVAPRGDAPVLKRLSGDLRALERDRQDGWIEIESPSIFVRGWIPERASAAGEDRGETVPPPPKPVPAVTVAALASGDEAFGTGRLARLLEPPPPAFTPRSAASERSAADAVSRFRASVRYLKSTWARELGDDLLGEVSAAGPGTVQVVVDARWPALPANAQERVLNRLFDRWLAASDAPQDLRVELRDPAGHLVMAKAGP
jgi:hypothetical protein